MKRRFPGKCGERETSFGATPNTGTETVLLVEDELFVRNLVGRYLRRLGYRVLEAGSGPDAMNAWQKAGRQIDMLFTDMVLPGGMSGLELAHTLKTFLPGLKVIISSGYSAEITQMEPPTLGGIKYLPKPYNMTDLGTAVRECLDQK